MNKLNTPQIGDEVLIISPEYAAGKLGVVCGEEVLANDEISGRWLIEVVSEKIVLSLMTHEFELVKK
ncbi:hypothetical protein NIES4101_32760 [Calothrix sp. NIES-4101]|nr:hypothetical protein NIES4101_32760 [Calothrix sp. NIES-4101]